MINTTQAPASIARTCAPIALNTTGRAAQIERLEAELAAAKQRDAEDDIIGAYSLKYDALVAKGQGDGCRCGVQVARAKDACFRLFDACLDTEKGAPIAKMVEAFSIFESTPWTTLGDGEAQEVVRTLWTLCPSARLYA